MEKIKAIVIGKGAYNAADIAGQSWEAFKADADKATAANKSAWFGDYGDQRDVMLREVYDQSVAAVKPKADPAKTPPAKP